MVAIIALVIIAVVSLLLIRVGATALVMTGVPRDAAVFQAHSAFFGVGFTTSESEQVVNHPVRRRIILGLIVSGNIGITSALATVLATIVTTASDPDRYFSELAGEAAVGVVVFGLIVLAWKIGVVQRTIDWPIRRVLISARVAHVLDYELLLRVEHGYGVAEVVVESGTPCAGKTLGESRLRDMGVVVLGIHRGEVVGQRGAEYIGVPVGTTTIELGDVLCVYGREDDIRRAFPGSAVRQ
jgi:hypothetical protein